MSESDLAIESFFVAFIVSRNSGSHEGFASVSPGLHHWLFHTEVRKNGERTIRRFRVLGKCNADLSIPRTTHHHPTVDDTIIRTSTK